MSSNSVHSHKGCCSHHHHKPSFSDWCFRLLEKVSAAALGVFAAIANASLFCSFFLAGIAVGLYQRLYTGKEGGISEARSSCSQGFLEQLTGVRLPRLLSLGVNLAITWCHIDHHTSIFVPIIGLSLGAWVGQSLASLSLRGWFHAPATA